MTADEILLAAVEKKTPAERAAYLDGACGSDAALRALVEGLLKAHEAAGSFLEQPLFEPAPTVDLPPDPEKPGTVIGPYKLLQQIGEGGMGTVFLAEQTQPVHRKVALKVIKPGMDSRQVIARFEAERQALAMMDHVNIARVFDGGTTGPNPPSPFPKREGGEEHSPSPLRGGGWGEGFGRPYFVMELVHGVPITKYCDDNRLTPRERLELFLPVCQAIQHAHQKGIIHRDIKPSNVLVTLYDGRPVPKVIDFGVAKATEQKLTERTLFTQYGTMVGTFEYMSPEQAEMSALGVDTRSDIYSLGVLLYELLTGSTPLSHKRVKEAVYAEVLRMIKEEEPPKPSARLSDSGEALASISANRHMEPAKLTKLVRGELDWIVMKALEKDRNRRYETANGFAADVQRYLADEPVQACPPAVGYRLRKFVRRNKGPVWAAAVVLLTLVGGITGTTFGLVRAEQRAEGERQAAEGERQAKKKAQEREAETNAVLDFVEKKIFAAARPQGDEGGLGRDVTLRQAIEVALPYVETRFADRPLIEARLRMTLGISFSYLREGKRSQEQCEKALAIRTKHLGPDHHETLQSMDRLAYSYHLQGRHAEALKLWEETLALSKAKLGPDHPDTLALMTNVANSYGDNGQHVEALERCEEVLALWKAKLGPDDIATRGAMVNVACCYHSLGRDADAVKVYEEALPVMKARWPFHEFTLNCINNLGNSYEALRRHGEALKHREEVLALRKAKLGADHPETLGSMHAVALSYQQLGRFAESVKVLEETVDLRKARLGPDHLDTLSSMQSLATSYAALGRHGEALKLDEQVFAGRKAKLGPDHPDTLSIRLNLATCYYSVGRHADALEFDKETLALWDAKHGPDHSDTLAAMSIMADNYESRGQHAEALSLHQKLLARRKAKLGPDHADTLASMSNVASCYACLRRYAESLPLHEEMLAKRKAVLGPDHEDTLGSMVNLANSYRGLGRHADAVKLYEEALPVMKAKLPDHEFTRNCKGGLADGYTALGRHADALKLYGEVLAFNKAKLGPDHSDTLWSMHDLATSYEALGRHEEASKIHEETLARRKAKLGPDHPDTLTSMSYLASCYGVLGRNAEALALHAETLAGRKARLGPDHRDTLGSMVNLASRYHALGRYTDAVKVYEEALPVMKAKIPDHFFTFNCMNNLANTYTALGRHADALKLHQEALALRKAKLGPNHHNTLWSMGSVAECLVRLDRGAEAVPLIDECLRRPEGKTVPPRLILGLIELRLRHFEKNKDATGCRTTAELWERFNRTDAGGLYIAACNRAVTAAVVKVDPKTPDADATRLAREEADRAMAWLHKAVAAGFNDVAHIKENRDLDALRELEDFKKLLSELQANKK